MNFPTPKILDATLEQAIAHGCDCVQFKYSGWPVTINCVRGACNVFAELGTRELLDTFTAIEPLDALFVGARLRGGPTTYLYDTWWLNGVNLQNYSYRERYALTRTNARLVDEKLQIVTVYPISKASEIWRDIPRLGHKGLVFRRSRDTAAGELYVTRYYVESPSELR